ncbi:MAG: hypothetical protein WCA61_12570 [Nitrososphaeraceae archaeon]
MYEDHLKTCEYCQKGSQTHNKPTRFIKSASSHSKALKPTIYVKSASSYYKSRKLLELAAIIKGVSYPSISYVGNANFRTKTKGASSSEVAARKPGPIEREVKLKELGKLVRGYTG